MGMWTLLIMLLLIFQLPVKYAQGQVTIAFDARNVNYSLHSIPSGTNANAIRTCAISPLLSSRFTVQTRTNYLPLSHYKSTEWSTFSLRYNNNTAYEWLNEHNLVMVKSLIQIANRLVVGINCHYNWCFTIAGNGAGMMLNKFPIKIYFAGVVGDAPNLGHR